MGRIYLVDAYNFALQDHRLDDLVSREGLKAGRIAFRDEAERLARREGCLVRLIFDGARGPFEHTERFENSWVDATFTSTGEKADERVVALAIQYSRGGHKVIVVSDDEEGVRRPLRGVTVTLLSTREFARILRARPAGADAELRSEALSSADREALARDFLARDEERKQREIEERRARPARAAAAPPAPARGEAPPPHKPPPPPPAKKPAPSPPPRRAGKTLPLAQKKARGERKQARRLALLQSKKPKR